MAYEYTPLASPQVRTYLNMLDRGRRIFKFFMFVLLRMG